MGYLPPHVFYELFAHFLIVISNTPDGVESDENGLLNGSIPSENLYHHNRLCIIGAHNSEYRY